MFEVVGPGFFDVAGMRLLAGRDFTWRDDESVRKVAVISESLSRRLFPAGDAIGKLIDFGNDKGLEIVGVVNSATLWSTRSHEPMAVYSALMQESEYNEENLDLRVKGDAAAIAPAARRVLESMGRHYALNIETIEQRSDRFLTVDRLIAMLSSFFGGLALLMASIGLYGLMSYAVERRTSAERELRDPALGHLRSGSAAAAPAARPRLVEALIALYEGRHEDALAGAEAAQRAMPSLYEAARLSGETLMRMASERRLRGDTDGAHVFVARAAGAYR